MEDGRNSSDDEIWDYFQVILGFSRGYWERREGEDRLRERRLSEEGEIGHCSEEKSREEQSLD